MKTAKPEDSTLWSILIPTIPLREQMFQRLVEDLNHQISHAGLESRVQVVSLSDNRTLSIGAKRNRLVQMATGQYISFVDDDDRVSPDYVPQIFNVLLRKPDVVGIVGEISTPFPLSNRKHKSMFYHTIKNKKYYRSMRGYERPPNHLNPMRRDIALQYSFEDISMGEDTDWAMRICLGGMLKKEIFLPRVIYYYDFQPQKDY